MNNDFLKIRYSFINILTGSDLSKRRLPVMMAAAREPGPVLWLTACAHGDEVGGIVVIHEVFRMLRKKLRRGMVYAFPMMNPFGFEAISRQIPYSREDLNRSFPGNQHGTLAERVSFRIFDAILDTHPDLVVDLHNDWIKSIPYTLIDLQAETGDGLYTKILNYCYQTGFLVVRDTDNLKHTLSSSLIHRGIPAITLELGESFIVNEKNVHHGLESVINLLGKMEMIDNPPAFFTYPFPEFLRGRILNYSGHPLSSSSGIVRFLVKQGTLVKKGQPVARIYNAFGKLSETVRAESDAMVLGYADTSVSFPGSGIMAFGMIKQ